MPKNKKKPEKPIPKSEFPEGLNLCRQNALSLLESAKILINENKTNHAVILFQFAKEEAGKLAWLINLSEESSETIMVPGEIFSVHKGKSGKAETLFGIDSWVLKGGFDKRYYDSGAYELAIESDHDTRLKCAFVDYNDKLKSWVIPGIETDKEVFLATIERAKEKLKRLSF